ncbi:MAG: enoyl-CoA hydratase-related protein [Caulobacteraceae bacterium]
MVNAIGPREAKALFVTGRSFDAAYAERIGLVHEVVADAAAMDHAMDRYIDWAMTSAPEAVADAKRLTWDVWARPIDHGLMEETAKRLARARTSEEGREGLKAFLERRKAAWRG